MDRFLENVIGGPIAKSTVINAGDISGNFTISRAGRSLLLSKDDDGHEIILAYLNAGDFFGEIGMFDENRERSAWVRTRTKCEVASIRYDRLRALAADFPEVLFAMLSQMALRLRNTSRKVGDLAFTDVSGRVARTLLDLCQQPDAMTHPDGMQIRSPVKSFAYAGCLREMVGRVLKNWRTTLITASGKQSLFLRPIGV